MNNADLIARLRSRMATEMTEASDTIAAQDKIISGLRVALVVIANDRGAPANIVSYARAALAIAEGRETPK